jgi:hypothetical protein
MNVLTYMFVVILVNQQIYTIESNDTLINERQSTKEGKRRNHEVELLHSDQKLY